MTDSFNSLENIWDGLLSRQPELVRATFSALSVEERTVVTAHLQQMAYEAGWHPEQRLSAQAALQALGGMIGTS
jgi:hypothetical protein